MTLKEPVDKETVDDEHIAGTGTHPCPDCGECCEIRHNVTEFSEYIYCEDCRKKFTRNREAVSEVNYLIKEGSIVTTDGEDEDPCIVYKCYDCGTEAIDTDYRLHKRTIADEKFCPIDAGIHGYDSCNLVCPCGEQHNGYLEIDEEVNCGCGRTYTLVQES